MLAELHIQLDEQAVSLRTFLRLDFLRHRIHIRCVLARRLMVMWSAAGCNERRVALVRIEAARTGADLIPVLLHRLLKQLLGARYRRIRMTLVADLCVARLADRVVRISCAVRRIILRNWTFIHNDLRADLLETGHGLRRLVLAEQALVLWRELLADLEVIRQLLMQAANAATASTPRLICGISSTRVLNIAQLLLVVSRHGLV